MSPRTPQSEHETLPILDVDMQLRRQHVASWVQNVARPVASLIEVEVPGDIDEEIVEEATHFEVRDYQLDAWTSLWQARQNGAKSGLIHLATGLGKTSVGVFDVIKFREEFEQQHGRQPRVLFTCHKNEILEQAAERFQAFIPDATQGFFNGDNKARDANVTLATLQSLYEHLGSFKRNAFDYIIYDEAHHSQADTFSAVVKHFRPKFKLALTATPDRMDQQDIRDLFGEELYSKGLAEALAEGWLAEPDYHIVFDDAVKQAMQSGFETTSLRALAELFDVKPRNEIIAKNIKEEMERIGLEFGTVKTIVFCQNIEHAEEMAELLGGKAYHSEAPKEVRKQTLREFRHGDLQIITTRDMFNEGVDIPDARLLVFLRSTSSKTVFEQQLGRGLRKHATKEKVSVLDFVANVERIAIIQDLVNTVRGVRNGGGTEGGNGDEVICGPEVLGGREGGGINIHTSNGDFDFDRLAVDLLQKFNMLKETARSKFVLLSNEDLVKIARRISPDKPLRQEEIAELSKDDEFLSVSALIKRFGTLPAFHKACGFDARVVNFKINELSDDDLIELALSIKPDGPLGNNEIAKLSKEGHFVSSTAIKNRFGSMQAFRERCGFGDKPTQNLSNEEVLAWAQRVSPNKPMGFREMNKLAAQKGFLSGASITRRFGSVDEFNRLRGFEQERVDRINAEELSAEDIVEIALSIKPGSPLTQQEVRELSKEGKFVSTSVINSRFGGMRAFHVACGFEVKENLGSKDLSNEAILALAKELKPDGVMSTKEIILLAKQGRFISSATVSKRFGSIRNFQSQLKLA